MCNGVEIKVGYNPINKRNTFTCGDKLSGQVELVLARKCTVQSLIVKMKGEGLVYFYTAELHFDGEKYLSINQVLIHGSKGNNVIEKGCHVYPFTFQIPEEDLPSSFSSKNGKIRYSVEAILSRPMKMDSKAKTEFTLINSDPTMMTPQQQTPQQQATEKEGMFFTSGSIGMHANVAKTDLCQGEGIQIVASIQNRSSRAIKPKFCLYQQCSYFAGDEQSVLKKTIVKEDGDPIPPSASQTITRTLTIPPDTSVSILNCRILDVICILEVYVDVKYAINPKLRFPIIILPALPEPHEELQQAHLSIGF